MQARRSEQRVMPIGRKRLIGNFLVNSVQMTEPSWPLICILMPMFGSNHRIARVLRRMFAASVPVLLLGSAEPQAAVPPGRAVRVAMKNVFYHFSENVAVHIVSLQGDFSPTRPGEIVVFDDKYSFKLAMSYAEISIGCDSLAHVLTSNVFSAPDAPIKELSIRSNGSTLIIKGKFRKAQNLPFEMVGMLSVTDDGRIRLHGDKIRAGHLPVKGLMDLPGLDIAGLINTKRVRGVTAEKDDLLLSPQEILPPPQIEGRVTAVRIQGNEIVQTFGKPQKENFASYLSGNYMAYRDNELRFGKFTMHDTDMVLIDMTPQDPFDFYLDHYKDQLVAGYSKTTPSFGLRVYMRDFNKLRTATSVPARQDNQK